MKFRKQVTQTVNKKDVEKDPFEKAKKKKFRFLIVPHISIGY